MDSSTELVRVIHAPPSRPGTQRSADLPQQAAKTTSQAVQDFEVFGFQNDVPELVSSSGNEIAHLPRVTEGCVGSA
jgi:hypothetical protein